MTRGFVWGVFCLGFVSPMRRYVPLNLLTESWICGLHTFAIGHETGPRYSNRTKRGCHYDNAGRRAVSETARG